jgi:hypothetical protein
MCNSHASGPISRAPRFRPPRCIHLTLVCVCVAVPGGKCTNLVDDAVSRKLERGWETMELIFAKLSSVFLRAALSNSGKRHPSEVRLLL